MPTHKLLLLPGDGIGPEVMAEVKKLVAWMNANGIGTFEAEEDVVGRRLLRRPSVSIRDDHAQGARRRCCDLRRDRRAEMGQVPYDVRPEAGLLRLRKLGLFANIRPAICTRRWPTHRASSAKWSIGSTSSFCATTGGVYFGEPKTITDLGNGRRRAIDTQVYDAYEIERIGRVAFELARKRRNKVTSMEKRNVMKTGRALERGE